MIYPSSRWELLRKLMRHDVIELIEDILDERRDLAWWVFIIFSIIQFHRRYRIALELCGEGIKRLLLWTVAYPIRAITNKAWASRLGQLFVRFTLLCSCCYEAFSALNPCHCCICLFGPLPHLFLGSAPCLWVGQSNRQVILRQRWCYRELERHTYLVLPWPNFLGHLGSKREPLLDMSVISSIKVVNSLL